MKKMGFCRHCEQWCDLGKNSWLPDHKLPNGEKCPSSRYSYWELKYELENETEAKQLSETIISDKGNCLQGGGYHSMACGDGEHCEKERLRRAKALADYFLKH